MPEGFKEGMSCCAADWLADLNDFVAAGGQRT